MKCFPLNVSELLVDLALEALHSCRMNMTIIQVRDDALGIVLVLNFHASESAHIDIRSEVLSRCHTLANIHVKIEGLVDLILAIREASLLGRGLCCVKFSVDAVLVTLAKEQLREGVGHKRLSLMLRVLGPI